MAIQRGTSRRQFLAGQSAVDAIADWTHGIQAEEADPAQEIRSCSARSAHLVQFTRSAMACAFAVIFNGRQYSADAEAAIAALDLVDALEDQLTVYREHSEVSRINRTAAERAVEVEPKLFQLLQLASELRGSTNGAFDVTSGPLSKAWGFSRRQGRTPSPAELREVLRRVDGSHVQLNEHGKTICFNKPGMEINLGGIGKGYALDRCAELLLHEDMTDFLLHGGKSSVLARGCCWSAGASSGGWTIGVRHPLRPEQRLLEVRLHDQALGTSGSATQSFHHQGRRYGHILDPRNGQPVEGILSATAVASSAAEADALSTAFYVMGAERAVEYCRARPGLGAMIVSPGRRSGTVDVHATGLADDAWKRLDD